MRRRITIKQLELLDAVARYGGFRSAAEKLAVSQPPLSLQMRKLEEALGAEVFDRGEKKAVLTPTGRLLADEAERLLRVFDNSIDKVRAFARGEAGMLRIGVTDEYPETPLFEKILDFSANNPEIRINTSLDFSYIMIDRLLSGGLDLILTNTPLETNEKNLAIHELPPSKISLVVNVADPLAKRSRIKVQMLHGRKMLGLPASSPMPLARQCRRLFAAAGVQPTIVHEIDDNRLLMKMVRHGLGVALSAPYLPAKADENIKFVEIDHKLAKLEHALVYRRNDTSPALKRLLKVLLEE